MIYYWGGFAYMYISYKKFFRYWWIIHEISLGKKKKGEKTKKWKTSKNKKTQNKTTMWTNVAGNPQLLYFWKVLFTVLIGNTREITRNVRESLIYLQRSADSFLLPAQRTVSLRSFTMLQKESYNVRYSLFVMAICCALHDILCMFTHVGLPLKCCKKQLARQSKSMWPHGKLLGCS